MEIKIRRTELKDKPWIKKLIETQWGSDFIVTRGRKYYYDKLEGFIAETKGINRGLITFRVEDREIEVISLDSLLERKGVGTELINKVIEFAVEVKARRVWLITTNDNIDAIKFYQKRGFRIIRIHTGAIDLSRKLKPSIPVVGNYGIPIRDEIELEMKLKNKS
jgi:N-acetylglutamate synthase-like GNAT family acetyltransferase